MIQNTTLIVMGVSSSGKSTLGKMLAQTLAISFYDADDYHSQRNIKKMHEGQALTDKDRLPWLTSLRDIIQSYSRRQDSMVLACSALKTQYRAYISAIDTTNRKTSDTHKIVFIYLQGSKKSIRTRIKNRKNHFFDPKLLDTQFNDLEEPQNAINISVDLNPDEQLKNTMDELRYHRII